MGDDFRKNENENYPFIKIYQIIIITNKSKKLKIYYARQIGSLKTKLL